MTKEQKEEFLQYLENLKLIQSDDFYREGFDIAISALSGNKGDTVSRAAYEQIKWERDIAIQQLKDLGYFLGEKPKDNKVEWIPFSEELPPKGKKVHVSTFGIVTIGERTSEANEALRLSIFDPMNNTYKNVDPYSYHITRWQPLPDPIKGEN